MIHDDAVREIHGAHCQKLGGAGVTTITVTEKHGCVVVAAHGDDKELTPWQARYLASKLYRLARRVERRTEKTS